MTIELIAKSNNEFHNMIIKAQREEEDIRADRVVMGQSRLFESIGFHTNIK